MNFASYCFSTGWEGEGEEREREGETFSVPVLKHVQGLIELAGIVTVWMWLSGCGFQGVWMGRDSS